MRDVVHPDGHRNELRGHRVGDVVDDDHRPGGVRQPLQELLDGIGGRAGGEQDRGVESPGRPRAFGVAGQPGCEQRDRDRPAFSVAKKAVT